MTTAQAFAMSRLLGRPGHERFKRQDTENGGLQATAGKLGAHLVGNGL